MPGPEREYVQCPNCKSMLAKATKDDIERGESAIMDDLANGIEVRPINGFGVEEYIKSRADIRYVHPPVNPFDYIKATEDAVKVMIAVNEKTKATYQTLLDNVPDCAERQLAIRKLQEFRMWVNCAVVMEQSRYGEYEFVETDIDTDLDAALENMPHTEFNQEFNYSPGRPDYGPEGKLL